MKMRTLLLVSAVILLVKLDAVSPHRINLKDFYEQAKKCNKSTDKLDHFVDDVSHLAKDGCQSCDKKRGHDFIFTLQNFTHMGNSTLRKRAVNIAALKRKISTPLLDEFFCKVHDVFHKNQELCKSNNKVLLRNLEAYFSHKNMNCEKTLETVTSTGVQIQLSDFLNRIKGCVRQRNFRGDRK